MSEVCRYCGTGHEVFVCHLCQEPYASVSPVKYAPCSDWHDMRECHECGELAHKLCVKGWNPESQPCEGEHRLAARAEA